MYLKINPLEMEFEDFIELMNETAKNLRALNVHAKSARYQFGDDSDFKSFKFQITEAMDGWVSSNC